MSYYSAYLEDIKKRKKIGLGPKPIDNGELIKEIISFIVDKKNKERKNCLSFFIYNVLPGTTNAALSHSHLIITY